MRRGKPTRLSVMYRLHAALPVSQKINVLTVLQFESYLWYFDHNQNPNTLKVRKKAIYQHANVS